MINNFPPTSRYARIETTTIKTPNDLTIIYLKRRFVPAPERFALLQVHVVKQGERLDNITAHYLGDAEQFWRICDANRASACTDDSMCDANRLLHPRALEVPATRLRITLPEGIPGAPNA